MPVLEEHVQHVCGKQACIGEQNPNVKVTFGKPPHHLSEVIPCQGFPSGHVYGLDAAGGNFVCNAQQIGQRQLRVMRIWGRHQAVTAAEVALAGYCPVNGLNETRGKHVVALPWFKRRHRLLGRFRHAAFNHFSHYAPELVAHGTWVHLLRSIKVEELHEQVLFEEARAIVHMRAILRAYGIRQLAPTAE